MSNNITSRLTKIIEAINIDNKFNVITNICKNPDRNVISNTLLVNILDDGMIRISISIEIGENLMYLRYISANKSNEAVVDQDIVGHNTVINFLTMLEDKFNVNLLMEIP